LLTGFEILGQIHVTECCGSMAGYYILDARCVMLNAKVHCAVPDCDSGERRLLACCRRQLADDDSLCRNRKIKHRLSEDFSAGCRKEQAGSLRSPEPAAVALVTALAHKISKVSPARALNF